MESGKTKSVDNQQLETLTEFSINFEQFSVSGIRILQKV